MFRVSDVERDAPMAKAVDEMEGPDANAELAADAFAAVDHHVGVAGADEAGRITFANRAFCRLAGYAPEELLGQDHHLLDAAHHPPELLLELRKTLANGKTWIGELEYRTKGGSERWVAATLAPLGPGSRGNARYVCICTDISLAKRRACEEILRHEEQLRQCDEQYAYAASHDLQEPLRAIVGCGQLLQQEFSAAVDPTVNQLVAHMIDGGKRMQQLVLDLLNYARVGTHRPRLVPLNSRDALAQASAQLRTTVRESAAEIDAQGLPVVLADPQQLVELFHHLLSNALEYRGAERPMVRVTAALDGTFWKFSVADNGIGIDPHSHNRVFLLFQRLHARPTCANRGIGLAVCKKIVERHGGRIWLESERGRGATFFFTLPARLRPAALDACQ